MPLLLEGMDSHVVIMSSSAGQNAKIVGAVSASIGTREDQDACL